jgi:hypothetical protein
MKRQFNGLQFEVSFSCGSNDASGCWVSPFDGVQGMMSAWENTVQNQTSCTVEMEIEGGRSSGKTTSDTSFALVRLVSVSNTYGIPNDEFEAAVAKIVVSFKKLPQYIQAIEESFLERMMQVGRESTAFGSQFGKTL